MKTTSRVRAIAAIVGLVAAGFVAPPAAVAATAFIDVSPDRSSPAFSEFASEIDWLASTGVSTGWSTPAGPEYRPFLPITRDAMAAFLYRYAGSPAHTPAPVSPFRDVATDSPFYLEISWLASTGLSTGWDVGGGVREYRPFASITRDAMAAFLFRFSGSPVGAAVAQFADVPPGTPFHAEIGWLAGLGITAGYDAPAGVMHYRPGASVTRDAMAAFLYRHSRGGTPQFAGIPTPGVSGTPAAQQTLTASAAGWSPAPASVTYQWLRGGAPIAGATAATYRVGLADAGASLTVRVSASRSGYLTAVRQSAPVGVSTEVGSSIPAGQALRAGLTMRSANGRFTFGIDGSGDLVVLDGSSPIWRSYTIGNAAAELRVPANGVLALVRPDGSLLWSSASVTGTASRLVLRDDGALVVETSAGSELWSSKVQGSVVFRLPFQTGQSWHAGAAHGGTGANWNALDFGPRAGSGASTRVVAIADGTVRWVTCASGGYIAIDHADGWSSGYYHMVNQQTQLIGQRVTAGTYLGDVGRTLPCGGGATFDHVHLTITYKGRPVHMNGFRFGQYVAFSGGQYYYGYWNDLSGRRVVTAPGGAACCLVSG